ncbi:MAG TPA: iron-sulfur cluster biosynthesis family protein [Nitrospira sp.]|nr:iron-sulfur cluster biosynthesis family protein [Nitrospira sp.]
MKLTRSAVERLKALIHEHPEDPIVRVQVRDLDEQRLSFSITLEDRVQSNDEVQIVDSLTVAIPSASALRMNGITMDYQEPDGFKFHHSDQQNDPLLNIISLN